MMISHATIWSIWIDRIFKGANKDVEEVFDAIKALSWCWCLNRLKIGVFMFYEWCWNLGIVYLGRFLVFCCSCSALGWLTNSPTVRHCVSLQLVGSVVSVMGLWLLSSAGGQGAFFFSFPFSVLPCKAYALRLVVGFGVLLPLPLFL